MGEEAKAYGARPKVKPLATMPKIIGNLKVKNKPLEPVQVRNQHNILKHIVNASTNQGSPPIPPTLPKLGSLSRKRKVNDTNQTEPNNQLPVGDHPQLGQNYKNTKLENKLPKSTLTKFSRMIGDQLPPTHTVKPTPPPNEPCITVIIPPVSQKLPTDIMKKFNSMLSTNPQTNPQTNPTISKSKPNGRPTPAKIEPTTPTTHHSTSTPSKTTNKNLAKLAKKSDTPTNKPGLKKKLKPAKPEKPTPNKKLGDTLKQWLLKEKTFPQVPKPKSDGTVERKI